MQTAARTTLSEAQRARVLDVEVADWSKQGYLVVSRSATAVQLERRRPSMLAALVVWAVLCVPLWFFGTELFLTQATWPNLVQVFLFGALLIGAFFYRRPGRLVYLRVDADGDITRD